MITNVGTIQIGDYVLCDMEFEGPKWVRVDEFHDSMEDATGVEHTDEWGSEPMWERSEPALSGEVICCLDSGVSTPVHGWGAMCFPLSSVREIRRVTERRCTCGARYLMCRCGSSQVTIYRGAQA